MTVEPPLTQHSALPLAQWPNSDRSAWEAAVGQAAFLEEAGRGAGWRAASQKSAKGAYARWLGWMITQDVDLEADAAAARITPERMLAYVNFLKEKRASVTVASYLGVLCMTFVAMFPDCSWQWLQALQTQLRRQASPIRNKRELLVPAGHLMQLGLALIDRAGHRLDHSTGAAEEQRHVVAAARDYRDGLIIALLSSRPLRVKNLLQIEIGIHLRQSGSRTTLHFAASETKNARSLDTVWPEVLEPALARYLAEIRPMLIAATAPGQASRSPRPPAAMLWVGQGGTPLTPGGLHKALARHTRQQFGHAINAHLFRDCVATTLANQDPDHIRNAAQLLGHTGLRVTERSYIAADSQFALRRHHDLVSALRSVARRRRQPSRKMAEGSGHEGAIDAQK